MGLRYCDTSDKLREDESAKQIKCIRITARKIIKRVGKGDMQEEK